MSRARRGGTGALHLPIWPCSAWGLPWNDSSRPADRGNKEYRDVTRSGARRAPSLNDLHVFRLGVRELSGLDLYRFAGTQPGSER